MRITNHKNLTDTDYDLTVWRYLTFPKFISLLTYQALWFSKLKILQDKYEGSIPPITEQNMRVENENWKSTFNTTEFQRQIDNWPTKNVEDGRELTVVNCWFVGTNESRQMWNEYVGAIDGLAIKSTIRKLATYIGVPEDPHVSQIGKVKYVNFETYEMSTYLAHQAHERAFIKDEKFQHEQEIRIATMSLKTLSCVSMKGIPYTEKECTGKNMNNFQNPGLYIKVHLKGLIDEIVLAPKSSDWFFNLVERIIVLTHLNIAIKKSDIV